MVPQKPSKPVGEFTFPGHGRGQKRVGHAGGHYRTHAQSLLKSLKTLMHPMARCANSHMAIRPDVNEHRILMVPHFPL